MSEVSSLAAPPLAPLAARPGAAARGALWWLGVLLFLAALFLPGYELANNRYWLPLFNRYMALALFALSVDLVWGYTGLLSLGQGLYFGLGGYAVGYCLKLQSSALEPEGPMPDFMRYCRLEAIPGWIQPLGNIWLALALAVIVPAVVAAVFGAFTFWRRIKGVYFSLITQALVLAMFILVTTQQPYTGGVVGMTYLAKLELFGHKFTNLHLYYLITGTLVVCFLGCLALVRSKFGRVLTAIRDSEYRVLALGYNTATYKTFVFALAGALAGLAGALYVAAMGTNGPDHFSMGFSIEVVIFVAVGGRGTLVGPVLGALLVCAANTYLNDENLKAWAALLLLVDLGIAAPLGIFVARKLGGRRGVLLGVVLGAAIMASGYSSLLARGPAFAERYHLKDKPAWPILLGLLFILVVVFLREGIVGALNSLVVRLRRAVLAPEKKVEGV